MRPRFAISFASQERRMRSSREDADATSKKRRGATPREAPGMPGVRCTRGFGQKNARGSATGSPVSHRHSLRSGFTVSFALSRVTGLSCHPRPREALASQELDASVGASGPHDFAVRQPAVRPRAESARRRDMRPPHPVPTFVTMADVPLFRNRTHRKGN
jgi:hypothetical protein